MKIIIFSFILSLSFSLFAMDEKFGKGHNYFEFMMHLLKDEEKRNELNKEENTKLVDQASNNFNEFKKGDFIISYVVSSFGIEQKIECILGYSPLEALISLPECTKELQKFYDRELTYSSYRLDNYALEQYKTAFEFALKYSKCRKFGETILHAATRQLDCRLLVFLKEHYSKNCLDQIKTQINSFNKTPLQEFLLALPLFTKIEYDHFFIKSKYYPRNVMKFFDILMSLYDSARTELVKKIMKLNESNKKQIKDTVDQLCEYQLLCKNNRGKFVLEEVTNELALKYITLKIFSSEKNKLISDFLKINIKSSCGNDIVSLLIKNELFDSLFYALPIFMRHKNVSSKYINFHKAIEKAYCDKPLNIHLFDIYACVFPESIENKLYNIFNTMKLDTDDYKYLLDRIQKITNLKCKKNPNEKMYIIRNECLEKKYLLYTKWMKEGQNWVQNHYKNL